MSVPTLTPRAAREQAAFRALLNAMARPGLIARLPETGSEPVLTVLEALLDHEVTFAVAPERQETIDAVLRQTGSHNVPLANADYVLTDAASLAQVLPEIKTGDLEYPDRSATVVCNVDRLGGSDGAGVHLSLTGPGISDTRFLSIRGLSQAAVQALQEVNAAPPLGTDVILLAPDGSFACLTRYTRLTEVQ